MNVYNASVTHSQPTLPSHVASESPLLNYTRPLQDHVPLERTLCLGVFMSLVVFVIVLGNSLIIASVARFRRLHTQPNYFIASLACADLLMGLIVVPFGATPIVSDTWTWYFGETFCAFWTALDIMCVTASIDTLCAIAVDRYIAVTRPLRYETLMNKRRARIVIVSVWVVSALISFLPMQMGWWKEHSPQNQGHAASNGSIGGGNGNSNNNNNGSMTCEFDISPSYAIVSSAVSFYLPMFVMIFVYSKVFREAQMQRKKIDRCEVRSNHQHHHQQQHHQQQHEHNNHQLQQQQQQMDNGTGQPRRPTGPSGGKKLSQILSRKDHKALKTMGLIMGTFTLCWLPFFVVNIVQVYCSCVPRNVFVILNWLGYANSAFNPIIYCRSPELRMAMKRLLCFWRSGSSGSGGLVVRRPLSFGTSEGGLASSPGWSSSKKRSSAQPETSSAQGFLMDEGGGGSCVITTPRALSCEDPGTAKVTATTSITNDAAAATAVTTSVGGGAGGEEQASHGDNGVVDANGNAHSCQ